MEHEAGNGDMFREPRTEREFPTTAVAIASVATVILVVFFVLLSRRPPQPDRNRILPLAAEAVSLKLTGLEMNESTSFSGGKSTYIDGKITNVGTATVTALTVQVIFRNNLQMPPQVETVPLGLIRTRVPYVDVEPISAEPLAPGAEREFRLIFEGISGNWNQQMPEIRIVAVKQQAGSRKQ